MNDIESVEMKVEEIGDKLVGAEARFDQQLFRVENICNDDNKIKFYTGFATFSVLMVCFNFLGPAVDKLTYRSNGKSERKSKKGRKRLLTPVN